MDIVESPNADPTAAALIDGQYRRLEDVDKLMDQPGARTEREQKTREEWLQSPHGQMCKELYDKFLEYKAFVEKDPDGAFVDYEEHQLFARALGLMETHTRKYAVRDQQNLERAQRAARCTHILTNGERCRAPRVRRRLLCHMHERMLEARAEKLELPPLEDANSIQLAIMKLQKAVIDGTLDHKRIGYLSNLIQIAAWNVSRTNFGGDE
jgi:hypothetical protein